MSVPDRAHSTPISIKSERLLRAGETCWRIEHADSVAFLIDGDAYFQALRQAIIRARRSVIMLCWDIDSRVRLVRDGNPDGYPTELGAFLQEVLARRPELHIHILAWDFHMIYALEREWWPLFPLRLSARRRLHFQMDDAHPVWACHHQKVVVVDDALAIVGGLDPTKNRWDTPEHPPEDVRRQDPDVGAYPPFHDVQLMVTGPVATTLGDLARERWRQATGEVLPPVQGLFKGSGSDVWPPAVRPVLKSIPIGIARTQPRFNGAEEIREVERLVLHAIGAARRHLYIESQYLTSDSVAAALVARLEKSDSPEILVIVHPNSTGWLEQHTMDVLRARVLRRIRAADRYGRLGVYYPHIPDLGERCMTMHSKLMIVDDEFIRVGSANLSNRSMGFDTECDLAFEAVGNRQIQCVIAEMRHRLLGEHLGAAPEEVTEILTRTGSLLAVVKELQGPGRSLRVFEHDIPPEIDQWVPDATLVDPARPLDEAVTDQLVPHDTRRLARRRVITAAAILLGLLGLAAAWRWGPLAQWLDMPELVAKLGSFKNSPAAPLIVLGAYVIGGLAVMPVTVLIAATIMAFGPWLGFTYSLSGTVLSAAVTYGLGRWLGRPWVHRLAGTRLNRLSHQLAAKGVLTILAVRIIPVAPFTVVNLMAGASHIRFRDFLLGTVLGLLPGLLGMTLFMDRLLVALREPGPKSIAMMALVAAVILAGALGFRRWLERDTREEDSSKLSSFKS
jgi:phospholipase D1/2